MISIITPLHAPGNVYIAETYASLKAQTLEEWEWIVVENNGGHLPPEIHETDERVKVFTHESALIGTLKNFACKMAQGDVIVELDNDDLLRPDALAIIAKVFVKGRKLSGSVDFAYSDFAEFKDGSWEPNIYSPQWGWSTYPVGVYDSSGTVHALQAMNAPSATAHSMRLVDWTPNHVRAWRAETYWKIGGHDVTRAVIDDHDFVVRFYLADARFHHIPECLYFYRVHTNNTVAAKNAAIRDATQGVYNQKFWKMAEKWAKDKKLQLIDLCGGVDCPPGYTSIDKVQGSGIQCDLEGPWTLEDSSVGLLRASDAIEHLRNPIHTMNEAWRVLAPGGFFLISVPSTNGQGAFCDPTHVSYWCKLSFRYYTNPQFARYIPEFTGKFQLSRLLEWFPSDWHRENNVPYIEAHLFCVKDGFRAMGEFLW